VFYKLALSRGLYSWLVCVCTKWQGEDAVGVRGTPLQQLLKVATRKPRRQQASNPSDSLCTATPIPTQRVLPRCFTEVMLRVANPARQAVPSLFKGGDKGEPAASRPLLFATLRPATQPPAAGAAAVSARPFPAACFCLFLFPPGRSSAPFGPPEALVYMWVAP
jgi:hypothetical protein